MVDLAHFRAHGWVRLPDAVPRALCDRLVAALASDGVPVDDPSCWAPYGAWMRDLVPMWGHQAQWDIRQHPALHAIWAALWGTDALWAPARLTALGRRLLGLDPW